MIKNLFSQDKKELMERAGWYEMEAVRAYDADQQAKGDIFMLMADTARKEARQTRYSRLMEKADHCISLAIRCDGKKRDRLVEKAYRLQNKALALTIEEASR